MKSLVIYHGNCADGFGAAYAAWKAMGKNAEYYAGTHNDPPPDVTGRTVYIVDFSYKRDVMEEIIASAASVTILDHHESAQADLESLLERDNVHGEFDMERSGAKMAWDYFHATPSPRLIDYIQDRDLWQFRLPGSKEVAVALFSYEYDFKTWDALMKRSIHELVAEGVPILRKHYKDINEFIVNATRTKIAGYDVPVISAPYQWASDLAGQLAEDEPFAACYWDTPDGRVFSLRSDKENPDALNVAMIATEYGGGGHKHAAGFRITLTSDAMGFSPGGSDSA